MAISFHGSELFSLNTKDGTRSFESFGMLCASTTLILCLRLCQWSEQLNAYLFIVFQTPCVHDTRKQTKQNFHYWDYNWMQITNPNWDINLWAGVVELTTRAWSLGWIHWHACIVPLLWEERRSHLINSPILFIAIKGDRMSNVVIRLDWDPSSALVEAHPSYERRMSGGSLTLIISISQSTNAPSRRADDKHESIQPIGCSANVPQRVQHSYSSTDGWSASSPTLSLSILVDYWKEGCVVIPPEEARDYPLLTHCKEQWKKQLARVGALAMRLFDSQRSVMQLKSNAGVIFIYVFLTSWSTTASYVIQGYKFSMTTLWGYEFSSQHLNPS